MRNEDTSRRGASQAQQSPDLVVELEDGVHS